MKRHGRRRFLRGALGGAAVAVALPPLAAAFDDHGTAWADGGALPDRFGVWFWGNGVRPERWTPTGTGAGAAWSLSDELAPLSAVKPWLSVVSGCEIKTATHPHHSGMTGILTGDAYEQVGVTRDTIVSTFARPSVDQIAADHHTGATPFRSLEVGVTQFRGTDEGTTFQHLSHNGPNNVNPSEYSPARLFERLFGAAPSPRLDLARASVLDSVMDEIRSVQGTVGSHDRQRLEQHFDSVRTLERRLRDGVDASCIPPEHPGTDFGDIAGRERIEEKNRAMSELLVYALTCDLTRSFSVLFSTAGSGVIVWQAGAMNSLHSICHTEPLPQPTVHAATVFTMEQLAHFLGTLRDTPEGDGNLLDRVSILATSELSDGWAHRNDEFPILVAGKGNGRLRGDVHYRSATKESTSHAVLTALRGGGVPASEFGVGPGRVTSGVSALEA